MTTKKYPISLNDEDQTDLQELIDLIGIAHTYGDVPKAIKFGIKLALAAIKNPTKVYSQLEAPELSRYLTSIEKYELRRRLEQEADILAKRAKEV